MTSRRVDPSPSQVLGPGPGLHVSGSCPASSSNSRGPGQRQEKEALGPLGQACGEGARERREDPLVMSQGSG